MEYHVETFCDKNKDELPKESDELFASSPNTFVVNLFSPGGREPDYCLVSLLWFVFVLGAGAGAGGTWPSQDSLSISPCVVFCNCTKI